MLKLTPKSVYAYNPYTNEKLEGDVINLVQNFPTAVIKFRVPPRVYWSIDEDPYVVMKLVKSDGSEISAEAEVIFAVKGATDKIPTEIGRVPYSGFSYLSIAEQLNVENRDTLRVDTPGEMTLLPDEELWVLVETDQSGENIDWSKSTFELRVDEHPYEG